MSRISRRDILKASSLGFILPPWLVHVSHAQDVSNPTTSINADAGSTLVQGVSSDEIVLGTSAAFTGPSRGLGIELYRGATSYFQYVNQNGGIHGRKVRLKLYDDGYQPVPAVTNTMSLMLEDEVYALFGYVGTPTVTRVLPLLKKFQDRNFILFFPFTGAQPQRELPYGDFAFNLRGSYRQETAGLVDNFVATGRKKIAVFYQADAYGRSGWAGVRAALKRHQLTIAGEATYRRGTKFTASMREQAERLLQYQPDAVVCIGSYAACAAFLRDAVDAKLEVPIANLSFVGSENLLKLIIDSQENSRDYTRWLVNSQVVPSYADLSLASVAQYRDFMEEFNPAVPDQFAEEDYRVFDKSFVSLEGFLNAKLMTEILKRLDDTPSRSELEQAVFSLDQFDLGIGEPVSFSATKRQGLDRVYYTTVDGDRFVPLKDWSSAFT
ncbi:MAG: ABC transporter substrate-binding protein [Gammaproteobacteria bacterium]|nr:ABC transporter substrate-binding protein [Gammaproteobacteria bacterium]